MRYAIHEIEVTGSLPDIRHLAKMPDTEGYALVVRRNGRVVGYIIQRLPPSGMPSPEELARLIAQEVGGKLLPECIADDLRLNQPPPPLPPPTAATCTHDLP